MAKKFFPECYELVTASIPHEKGTQYKVSIGMESWGQQFVPVVKVQMMYNGVVSGRRSPSYPVGSDDYERVLVAVNKLKHKKGLK